MVTNDYEESYRSCWCPGHISFYQTLFYLPAFATLFGEFSLADVFVPLAQDTWEDIALTKRWPSTA